MTPSEFEQLQEQAEKEGFDRGYKLALIEAAEVVSLQNGPGRGELIVSLIEKIHALADKRDEKEKTR